MFLFYRVRAAAESAGRPVGRLRRIALAAVTALVLLVAVPLTIGTLAVAQDEQLAADAHPVAEEWARDGDWHIESVAARNGVVMVDALGLPRNSTRPTCARPWTAATCAPTTWSCTWSAASRGCARRGERGARSPGPGAGRRSASARRPHASLPQGAGLHLERRCTLP